MYFGMILLFFLLNLLILQQRSRFFAPGLRFCNAGEDDSDMKIAGSAPKIDQSGNVEEELEALKSSGDLEKARKLSIELSEKIINEDGGTTFGLDASESDEVRQQRRLLMAFVVDYTVDRLIKNSILGTTVINGFYDALKKNVPEFYEDIRESASFSFYLLCIRRGGSTDCMGSSFAMLAGCEGNEVMAELGQALFYRFSDIVEQSIHAYHFNKV